MSSFGVTMAASSVARFDARTIAPKAAKTSASGALYPDLVYLQKLTESADGDAGTVESFDQPGVPLSCSVTATKTLKHAFAAEQEVGVTPVLVAFAEDPGAAKGDRLEWQGRHIRLFAPARPEAGAGSLYLAQGEIRD